MSDFTSASGTPVVKLLDGATATGTSLPRGFSRGRGKHAMQTTVSGTVATITVLLEGSLDGVNWFTLATSSAATGDVQYVVDKPVGAVRANVTTLTGAGATVNVFHTTSD